MVHAGVHHKAGGVGVDQRIRESVSCGAHEKPGDVIEIPDVLLIGMIRVRDNSQWADGSVQVASTLDPQDVELVTERGTTRLWLVAAIGHRGSPNAGH